MVEFEQTHQLTLTPPFHLYHHPSDPQGINYLITTQDIFDFEQTHQLTLTPGSIVLFYTGWSSFWQQGAKQYLGNHRIPYHRNILVNGLRPFLFPLLHLVVICVQFFCFMFLFLCVLCCVVLCMYAFPPYCFPSFNHVHLYVDVML